MRRRGRLALVAVEERVTFCRICEPLCGMVATVEDGRLTQLRPDHDHPLSQGYACPKGIAMADVQNDPDRVALSAQAHRRPRRVRARHLGGGDERHRRAPAAHPRRARPGVGRLVHGQPGRVQLQPHAVGEGLPRRARQPALLLRRVAGREQPLRRVGAAVRVAAARADPGPQPHGLPVHGRREPARVTRLGAVGAACARAAERDRRPRRARRRGGPAPLRDRAPVRARRDPARRRRLAAALDAARDLRRGARRTAPRSHATCAAREALAERARGFDPERTEAVTGVPAETRARARARLRDRAERRRLRAHRILPGPLRHAGRVPARRAQRRHRQPRPPRRRGVRPAADRARRARREGRPRDLRQGALALRRLPGRDRQPARRR